MPRPPRIAVVTPNLLTGLGLRALLERIIPMGEVALFGSLDELLHGSPPAGTDGPDAPQGGTDTVPAPQYADGGEAADLSGVLYGGEEFYHYFVTPGVYLSDPAFFGRLRMRTILLTDGAAQQQFAGLHCLNVHQREQELVRDILRMHQGAHRHGHGVRPDPAGQPLCEPLTPRETEVLRLVVRGLQNKQIAAELGIALTTVISHRKRITEKLGVRSVAGLTIYAVMRGLVGVDAL